MQESYSGRLRGSITPAEQLLNTEMGEKMTPTAVTVLRTETFSQTVQQTGDYDNSFYGRI